MGSNTVSIAVILLNSILVQNIVLGKFLGICPFVGAVSYTHLDVYKRQDCKRVNSRPIKRQMARIKS